MRTPHRNGMALAVTLILALVLGVIGASFLSMTTTVSKTTEANYSQHAVVNVLEMGVDRAMVALRNYADPNFVSGGKFSKTWALGGDANWKQKNVTTTPVGGIGFSADFNGKKFPLGNGRFATLKVTVQRVPTTMLDALNFTPFIVSEATYLGDGNATGSSYTRQIVAFLAPNPAESRGLIAQKGLALSGNNVLAIGYDSSKGSMNYNKATQSGTNYNDLVTVASASKLDGDVTFGNANVFGRILVGGADTNAKQFGPNAHVWSSTDQTTGTAYAKNGVNPDRTAGGFSAEFPVATAPAASTPLTVTGSAQTVTTGTYVVSKIDLSGKASNVVTISGDVTLVMTGDISIAGSASIKLAANSKLKIYTDYGVSITGGGVVNTSVTAAESGQGVENLRIYGTNKTPGAQEIKVAGNGAFTGIIDAPNASVKLAGGGSSGIIFGSIKAYDITANGGVEFYYDSNGANNIFKAYGLDYWIDPQKGKVKIANFF